MPAARSTPAPHTLHELRIVLLEVTPPVWRLVRVRSDATLGQFHGLIQAAMGWSTSHRHAFRVKERNYGDPASELEGDEGDEFKVTLHECLTRPGDKIRYEYDVGDSWQHEVKLVAIEPAVSGAARVECIDGARACPPDDVGGPAGYQDLVAILKDPKHEEHADRKGWLEALREEYAEFDPRCEGPFDAEAFDVARANDAICALSKGRRWEPGGWPASA